MSYTDEDESVIEGDTGVIPGKPINVVEYSVDSFDSATIGTKSNAPALRNTAIANIYQITVDLALGTDDDSILEAYNLQSYQLNRLREDERVKNQVQQLQRELAKDGVSFKLKARMLAEDLLPGLYSIATDPKTDPKTRHEIGKSFVRWAEYEAKSGEGGSGGGMQIVIKLPGG